MRVRRSPHDEAAFPSGKPIVLGLLGGVASGKSLVAALLGAEGFVVLDADRIAHRVLHEDDLRPDLVALLGSEILTGDGKLDRGRIAELVFRDSRLRTRLEELTHPRIRSRLLEALERALSEGRSVVLDVPLLFERGLIDRCDHVIFVDLPDDVRRERAQARGMSEADWRRREKAQADLSTKRARADFVVGNESDREETRWRLGEILRLIRGA